MSVLQIKAKDKLQKELINNPFLYATVMQFEYAENKESQEYIDNLTRLMSNIVQKHLDGVTPSRNYIKYNYRSIGITDKFAQCTLDVGITIRAMSNHRQIDYFLGFVYNNNCKLRHIDESYIVNMIKMVKMIRQQNRIDGLFVPEATDGQIRNYVESVLSLLKK